MLFQAFLSSIALSLMGLCTFSYIAQKIFTKFPQKANYRGMYVGPLSIIGSFIGVLVSYFLNRPLISGFEFDYNIFVIITSFATIGFLRDKLHFSKRLAFTICFIVSAISIFLFYKEISIPKLLEYSCFMTIMMACLKLSSLVYEMPFILISTSSFTHLLFLINGSNLFCPATLIDFSLLVFSIATLLYTFSGQRILIGDSGIFAAGSSLAIASILEPSGNLVLFSFFIPAMSILFPILFVCIMLTTSYFGNKLHKSENDDKHNWKWTLNREKVINFTGLVFLCLNFTGLLATLKAPNYGYIFLFVLLLFTLIRFIKAFARKISIDDNKQEKVEILGIQIDAITPEEVLVKIKEHISNPDSGFMHIITADSMAIVRTQKEQDFKNKMEAAEMVVPDGAGIVWASDFIGTPLPSRVPGVALVRQICEASIAPQHKIFFIGSKPGIAEKAAEVIKEQTKANIVGVEHGFFKKDSEEEIQMLQKISDSKADIVFVALGVPRQEDFITKLRSYSKHIVAIGVGGSFDVISGTLPRAPQWMQRCGIEWLFRLFLEPKRITRMIEIPVFVLKVMQYKLNND